MDRATLETYLEHTGRLIADGERNIARQEQIVAVLEEQGLDTSMAAGVLESLRIAQALFMQVRARVIETIAQLPPPE